MNEFYLSCLIEFNSYIFIFLKIFVFRKHHVCMKKARINLVLTRSFQLSLCLSDAGLTAVMSVHFVNQCPYQ